MMGHFRAGLEVVRRYPILIVPPLSVQMILWVLGVLWVITLFAKFPSMLTGTEKVGHGTVLLLLPVLSGLLIGIGSSAVVVMAQDALAARPPAIGRAVKVMLDRLRQVLVVSFLLTVIMGIGLLSLSVLLSPGSFSVLFFSPSDHLSVVLVTALLVVLTLPAAFFLIFTLPSVLLDGRSAASALGHSVRLVRANPGTVMGLVLRGLGVAVVGWFLGLLVGGVVTAMVPWDMLRADVWQLLFPPPGPLAAAVVTSPFISYLTVVGVRVYEGLDRA